MSRDKYRDDPSCPDCAIDAKGRLVCLLSKGETNAITHITLCRGIHEQSCSFKADKQE